MKIRLYGTVNPVRKLTGHINAVPNPSLISDNNETIEDLIKLQNIFGGQFIHANIKQENLNKYIKSINFAITK